MESKRERVQNGQRSETQSVMFFLIYKCTTEMGYK